MGSRSRYRDVRLRTTSQARGLARTPSRAPWFHCDGERIMQRLLGSLKVAEETNQGCEDSDVIPSDRSLPPPRVSVWSYSRSLSISPHVEMV